MRIAALAIRGEGIEPRPSKLTPQKANGRGGLYTVVKRYSHSAPGKIEAVVAIQEAIRRIIDDGKRNPVSLELLDELSSEILAIMLDRDAEGAWSRIAMALGDDAEAFYAGIGKAARLLIAA